MIAVMLISGITVFFSCEKEEKTVLNQNHAAEENLFIKLVSQSGTKSSPLLIDKFSESLYSLNIKQIMVNEIQNDKIYFEVSAGLLFVNSEEFNLDKSSYSINKLNDVYEISKENSLIGISYNTTTNEFFIKNDDIFMNIDELNESDITPQLEKEFITQVIILNEFVTEGLHVAENPNIVLKNYEGTGVGFHLSLADAHHFCQADYDQILADNPDWWSPGISYSCVFGEHFCMCTANFYSE